MNNIIMHNGDLYDSEIVKIFKNNKFVTIDTETTGLDPLKDKLCIIQIYDGKDVYILKYNEKESYENLNLLFSSQKVRKVFHHANFDLRFLINNLKLREINNVSCTKISAKLLNGNKENNSLKYLVDKYLDIPMNKDMQTSDWSKKELSQSQLEYACNDVTYLYELWIVVEKHLKNKGKYEIAESCFQYLPINAVLHNKGIENIFIY